VLFVRGGVYDEVLHAPGWVAEVTEDVVESSSIIVSGVADSHWQSGVLV
jgi:hypothetical protein